MTIAWLIACFFSDAHLPEPLGPLFQPSRIHSPLPTFTLGLLGVHSNSCTSHAGASKNSRSRTSYDFQTHLGSMKRCRFLPKLLTFLMPCLGPALPTKNYENQKLVLFEAWWGPKLCTSKSQLFQLDHDKARALILTSLLQQTKQTKTNKASTGLYYVVSTQQGPKKQTTPKDTDVTLMVQLNPAGPPAGLLCPKSRSPSPRAWCRAKIGEDATYGAWWGENYEIARVQNEFLYWNYANFRTQQTMRRQFISYTVIF